MSKKTSLRQFLMKSGKFERVYGCISAIKKGKITVNQKVITNPHYFFNPKTSFVKLNGERIKQVSKLYFLLNKPEGYLSQKSPDEKTIYGLLKKSNVDDEAAKSLFAVGRLDKDTEGLMIMTNDGKLSDFIMNPENEIGKKYHVTLEKPISNESIKLIEKGVIIEIENDKYKTTKCKIRRVADNELYISITEGKKRQIRKMFEAVGNKVSYLKRVSIGELQLGNLSTGELKPIPREEIYGKLSVQ